MHEQGSHNYLDVDLSLGRFAEYRIPDEWIELHVGGRGIGLRILWEELAGDETALSPANIVVFATGPFQGTGLAGAGRHAVLSISPKTGAVADSYVGGYFGHELGRTGYEGLLIRGRAESPVTLVVAHDGPRLVPADKLWGRGTGYTESSLREAFPGARVACIGPAGENLVHMACIIHDRSRAAGRPGLGAVMGSKLLKAIVVKGRTPRTIADPTRFRREQAEFARIFTSPSYQSFGEQGTARLVLANQEIGLLPTRNFQRGTFESAEKISAERLHDTVLIGRESCAGCPIRCKRKVKTTYGESSVSPDFGGPEYETLAAFGSLCLCDDLDAICLANQRCNDLGLDTISAGVCAAFLMEASEAGVTGDTYPWGDPGVILRVVEELGARHGIGERLASGLDGLAQEWNVDFNMTIKGVEIPMHDPRGKQSLALSYACSPRGATHLEGVHDTMVQMDRPAPELGLVHGFDRFTLLDKPHMARVFEDVRSFENSLVLCVFVARSFGPDYRYSKLRSLLEAATGLSVSAQTMIDIGSRNYLLMRLHAIRMGAMPADDRLPQRFHVPLPEGASANRAIDPDEMTTALRAYYKERGYDATGTPTPDTLAALGLEELVPFARHSQVRRATGAEPATRKR